MPRTGEEAVEMALATTAYNLTRMWNTAAAAGKAG
jgi:hypothetical protein